MDTQESRKLATRVAKESTNVVVKFGKTNGRNCLHLRVLGESPDSQTIYSVEEWNLHQWNHANRPKKKKAADNLEIQDAVANKEAA
jgi:hypothetical protein